MSGVLGIDAAWTEKNPSGVALLEYSEGAKPRLLRIGRSYDEYADNSIDWKWKAAGSHPNIGAILDASSSIVPSVDVIALDIPLSSKKISSRRSADQAISKEYGGRGASTHTPGIDRPGKIGETLFSQLTGAGYKHATTTIQNKSFIEIYPHPAIIELLDLDYRLPYKVANAKKYWPDVSLEERRRMIIENLNQLRDFAAASIDDIDRHVPNIKTSDHSTDLKGFEDALDAIYSALVGCYYLAGKARALGDQDSAIWVPTI